MKQVFNFALLALAVTLQVMVVYAQIDWQSGGGEIIWARACDFSFEQGSYDMTPARVPSEQCGNKCLSTNGCTHFEWTDYAGGTCWMKWGNVLPESVIFNSNYAMVCGIVPENFNRDGNPGKK